MLFVISTAAFGIGGKIVGAIVAYTEGLWRDFVREEAPSSSWYAPLSHRGRWGVVGRLGGLPRARATPLEPRRVFESPAVLV